MACRTPPHILHHHTLMDMWLVNHDDFEHLTPDDYASGDTFSTPDDLEGYPQAEDRFLKYSEDPPALIACAVYFPTVVERWLTVGSV